MPHYKVIRSFGGFKRGETAELTAKDAKNLLEHNYIEETAPKQRKPRKTGAKKTAAPEAPSSEVAPES